ncbi:CDP-6-deoxy-delta-3,4-glucoseen reductase [Thiohalophilus sp.]|uniref:CDP-6-deoxy-delta-3,4-glucoseen reductase n=1 Tax=Thiohalophilus sp. TaxID=3028392 RepID=UPI003974E340
MSFSVKVEPSGHTFPLEENESILDAALRHGLALPYGCRNGACGSCMGKVVEGKIAYSDDELPPALTKDQTAAGMALFCQAVARSNLVIETREVAEGQDIPIKKLPSRIAEMTRLNHDVMLLKLKLPSTERLQFLAGQYVDFILKDGRRRSFSLANAPHDDDYLVLHIRHVEGGSFTGEVFDKMKVKDILRIEGPFGGFYLREESDRPIIFMAGGTGFAPIKGMIEHAFASGIERPMHLYWGARAKRDLYLPELPEQWAEEHTNFSYTPVLSEPMVEDHWQGRTGYVHDTVIVDHPQLAGYDIYASGPPPMVYAGQDAFPGHGLDLEHYYSDAFEYNRD